MNTHAPAVVVDCPLDEETLHSIILIRKMRLKFLKELKKDPAGAAESLKALCDMDPKDMTKAEISKAIQERIDELESIDEGTIRLNELQSYLEILSKKSS